MTPIVFTALIVAAGLGLGVGGRHLYLRLDRPGGFECSLRVIRGDVDGLGSRFRAGYAGPGIHQLFWRRIAWPGRGIHIATENVRVDRARRPAPRDRLAIPATFTIMSIEVDPETTLELALPSRRLERLIAMLGGPDTRSQHR